MASITQNDMHYFMQGLSIFKTGILNIPEATSETNAKDFTELGNVYFKRLKQLSDLNYYGSNNPLLHNLICNSAFLLANAPYNQRSKEYQIVLKDYFKDIEILNKQLSDNVYNHIKHKLPWEVFKAVLYVVATAICVSIFVTGVLAFGPGAFFIPLAYMALGGISSSFFAVGGFNKLKQVCNYASALWHNHADDMEKFNIKLSFFSADMDKPPAYTQQPSYNPESMYNPKSMYNFG